LNSKAAASSSRTWTHAVATVAPTESSRGPAETPAGSRRRPEARSTANLHPRGAAPQPGGNGWPSQKPRPRATPRVRLPAALSRDFLQVAYTWNSVGWLLQLACTCRTYTYTHTLLNDLLHTNSETRTLSCRSSAGQPPVLTTEPTEATAGLWLRLHGQTQHGSRGPLRCSPWRRRRRRHPLVQRPLRWQQSTGRQPAHAEGPNGAFARPGGSAGGWTGGMIHCKRFDAVGDSSEPVQHGSTRLRTGSTRFQRFDAVRHRSTQFRTSSKRYNTIQHSSTRFSAVQQRLNTAQQGSTRFNKVQQGSTRFNKVQQGSTRFSMVQHGSTQFRTSSKRYNTVQRSSTRFNKG